MLNAYGSLIECCAMRVNALFCCILVADRLVLNEVIAGQRVPSSRNSQSTDVPCISTSAVSAAASKDLESEQCKHEK